MDNITLIGTVSLLNLLAVLSPGPDFVMSVKNSLNYSRKTGIFTAIGIGLGLCIHLAYCAAGIGYIIATSAAVFTVIKYAGAAYLIYMGVGSIIAKKSIIHISNEKKAVDITSFQAIKIGFLTNVLNPKAALFFLGIYSLMINGETPLYVVLIISLIIVSTAIVWFTLVALFFTQQKIQLAFLRFESVINKSFGGLLILLGVKLAFTKSY